MKKVYSKKDLVNIGKKSYMGESIWVQGIVGFILFYLVMCFIAVMG